MYQKSNGGVRDEKIMLITIAVLLIGGMTLAVGYGTKAMQRVQDPTTCENFVDADGDGINDNCPNGGVRELKNAQGRNRLQARRLWRKGTRTRQRIRKSSTALKIKPLPIKARARKGQRLLMITKSKTIDVRNPSVYISALGFHFRI